MATNNAIDSNIPIEISNGGMNATSMATNYGVAYFDGSKIATLASVGTTDQVLTSNGAGFAPSFQNFSGGGGIGASAVSANLLSNSTIPAGLTNNVGFDNELFDVGSNYDTTTKVFTCPEDGFYVFQMSAFWESDSASSVCILYFGGARNSGTTARTSPTAGANERPGASSPYSNFTGKPAMRTFSRDAGDGASFGFVNAFSANKIIYANSTGTFMTGYLVGT